MRRLTSFSFISQVYELRLSGLKLIKNEEKNDEFFFNHVSDRGEAWNRNGTCHRCLDPANKRSWPLG